MSTTKKHFMTPLHLQKAWDYMRSHAQTLITERPTDEQFARLLKEATGLEYSISNARSLKRHKVTVDLGVNGEAKETVVTWYARREDAAPKGTPRTKYSLFSDIRALTDRVESLERLVRNICSELGVKVE